MKIAVIGAGNIGLITALCLAEKDHEVYCVDINHRKIESLAQGQVSLYEPGLEPLLQTQLSQGRITFCSSLKTSPPSDAVFIAVGTPNKPDGSIDMDCLESAVDQLAKAKNHQNVIIRSTVPPGTHVRLAQKYPDLRFISCPEFLSEGRALEDCRKPSRILVGSSRLEDLELIRRIFGNFDITADKFILMDPTSAEVAKYASNIFLAARVSLINEFSRICDYVGADIKQVQHAIALDQRIGTQFLNAGIGFGGSCLPKDIDALLHYARKFKVNLDMVESVKSVNLSQIKRFADNIIDNCEKNSNSRVCFWGLSFKPDTDDLREAPSLYLVSRLNAKNIATSLYDPRAANSLREMYKNTSAVNVCDEASEALSNADALIICTEWPEFVNYDLKKLKSLMKSPVIFDGRNIYDPATMKALGFEYHSIGRPS